MRPRLFAALHAVNSASNLRIGWFAKLRRVPGIHHRDMRHIEIATIARDDCKAMLQRCGGNDEVGLRTRGRFYDHLPSEHAIGT